MSVSHILKSSIEFETMKKHLSNMVDEHYANFVWSSDSQLSGFASLDFAREFVEAAKACGRTAEAADVQKWIDEKF